MAEQVVALEPAALPAMHRAADAASGSAQRGYLLAIRVQIAVAILGALAGLAGDGSVRWLGWVSVVAFVILLVAQFWQRSSRLQARWYQARAAAEAAKTLAWRYAVGAPPFDPPPQECDRALVDRLHEVAAKLKDVQLPVAADSTQISEAMRTLRAAPLATRMAAYQAGRLGDQVQWYSARSSGLGAAGLRWDAAFYTLAVVSILGAVSYATGTLDGAIAGVATTVLAGVLTWMSTRNHQTLATSYALAALELSLASELARTVTDEPSWRTFVDDAEAAISREHSLWLASRSKQAP